MRFRDGYLVDGVGWCSCGVERRGVSRRVERYKLTSQLHKLESGSNGIRQ